VSPDKPNNTGITASLENGAPSEKPNRIVPLLHPDDQTLRSDMCFQRIWAVVSCMNGTDRSTDHSRVVGGAKKLC
jgi:hypothetical protein